MNTKRYIATALIFAFLGWLVFWPEEQPPDQGDNGHEPESSIDTRRFLREPEPLPPEDRYGIAGMTSPPPKETPHGKVQDYYYGHTGPSESRYAPAQPQPEPLERYTFRPLTERERRNLEAERPAAYPYYGGTTPPDPSRTPQTYAERRGYSYPRERAAPGRADFAERQRQSQSQRSAYADHRFGEHYSFRPLQHSPSSPQRWQGPYPQRAWSNRQDASEPWTAPPDPQWGSTPPDYWTPPTERMYPSLDRTWGKTLTAN